MALENQRDSVHVIFKEIGNVHEPDIIKRIFFYLDYDSFKKCQRVSRSWRSLLTSEAYISMGKIVFQKELVRIQRKLYEEATEGELEEVVKLISCHLVDVDCVGLEKITPLGSATREGHIGVIQALLDRGADPNKPNVNGFTPVHWAANKSHKDVVNLLNRNGKRRKVGSRRKKRHC